ncbi:hypothetical protein QQF64_021250 [Cirrhinus molitorella]|uniref:Uncharacterized protein n=1 Tax=Cirrhinus molitorella TaxID=172907 RepID=A0ABR3LCW6_9TELE
MLTDTGHCSSPLAGQLSITLRRHRCILPTHPPSPSNPHAALIYADSVWASAPVLAVVNTVHKPLRPLSL